MSLERQSLGLISDEDLKQEVAIRTLEASTAGADSEGGPVTPPPGNLDVGDQVPAAVQLEDLHAISRIRVEFGGAPRHDLRLGRVSEDLDQPRVDHEQASVGGGAEDADRGVLDQ